MAGTSIDWPGRVRAALARANQTPDEDVVEELGHHARAMYAAARADGDTPEAAARRVDLQIALWADDAAMLKRRPRAAASVEPPPAAGRMWASGLAHDCRYALRLLRRRPAFTALVVAIMALGLGGTTTLFSVANGVLFTPLPWSGADRLAIAQETRGGHRPRFGEISNGAYLAWRDQATTLEGIAAWSMRTVTMSGQGDAARVQVAAVTPDLLPLLGVQPLAGTLFTAGDDTRSRGDVILISEGLWRTHFNAEAAALGRPVQIEGKPHTIVGVVPDRQAFPDRLTRAWIPLSVPPASPTSAQMLSAILKLRPGASIEHAAAEATSRAQMAPPPIDMLITALFGGTGAVEISVTPLHEARTAHLRPALLIFLAAVGLLFVTATANVAGLILARSTTRTREMAIRAAIGAGRLRVVRQLLIESLALGMFGGAAGLAIAWVLHRLMPLLLTPEFLEWRAIGIDVRVVLFAAVLSIVAGLAVGLVPALRARRVSLVESLGQDGAGSVGLSRASRAATLRWLTMAGQVATACILLVGALLLARSVAGLMDADRGYEPSQLLTAQVPMTSPALTPARRAEFAAGIVERLRALPGVTAAAFTDGPAAARGSAAAFTMDGRTVQAESRMVTAGYFAAMGMRILEGRAFTEEDAISNRPVLIVNRTFAREYLQGQASGRHVRAGLFDGAPPAEILAVVDDVRHRPERDEPEPQVYLVTRSRPDELKWSSVTLLARTADDPVALVPALREIAREQDPAIAVGSLMTMNERLRASIDGPRIAAVLLGSFAGFAVLIAAIGLFGSLTYTVAQRSREIALRTALGARPGQIARLILLHGLAVASAGVAVGVPAAFALAQALGTNLYGVSTKDPVTYAAVPLLMLAVALAACAAPVRRATRLDPLRLLKSE